MCKMHVLDKIIFDKSVSGRVMNLYMCRNMARSTQFPIMITRSTIIYEIVSPGAAGSSIYI